MKFIYIYVKEENLDLDMLIGIQQFTSLRARSLITIVEKKIQLSRLFSGARPLNICIWHSRTKVESIFYSPSSPPPIFSWCSAMCSCFFISFTCSLNMLSLCTSSVCSFSLWIPPMSRSNQSTLIPVLSAPWPPWPPWR